MTRSITLLALTALSLTACSGVSVAPLPGTPVPMELQGEWLHGRISSI